MPEKVTDELIMDGARIMKARAAKIIVSNGVKTKEVTEKVDTPIDAAYFAMVRDGYDPASLAVKPNSDIKYRLSEAIEQVLQTSEDVDQQG